MAELTKEHRWYAGRVQNPMNVVRLEGFLSGVRARPERKGLVLLDAWFRVFGVEGMGGHSPGLKVLGWEHEVGGEMRANDDKPVVLWGELNAYTSLRDGLIRLSVMIQRIEASVFQEIGDFTVEPWSIVAELKAGRKPAKGVGVVRQYKEGEL